VPKSWVLKDFPKGNPGHGFPKWNPAPEKKTQGIHRMEAERTNLIGGKLADLAARTEALRGYL
jgi:hypothetical protein